MIFVYTTLPDWLAAQAFSAQIIEQKLAACINIMPEIMSLYEWEGEIEQKTEVSLLIKTSEEKLAALKEFFKAEHPYDVPAFAHWRADTTPDFGGWVKAQVGA